MPDQKDIRKTTPEQITNSEQRRQTTTSGSPIRRFVQFSFSRLIHAMTAEAVIPLVSATPFAFFAFELGGILRRMIQLCSKGFSLGCTTPTLLISELWDSSTLWKR